MARPHRTDSSSPAGNDAALSAQRSAIGRKGAAATLARDHGHMSRMASLSHEATAREKLRQAMLFPQIGDDDQDARLPDAAHQIIRLLMAARRDEERFIVAFHLYQALPIDQAAARIGISPARAAELLDSLRHRLSAAKERHHRELILSKGGTAREPL